MATRSARGQLSSYDAVSVRRERDGRVLATKRLHARGARWVLAAACLGCVHGRRADATGSDGGGTPTPAVFPLTLSADRRHVVDQRGRPFLIQGDSAWSLIAKLTREETEVYLEDRRHRGFDAILVNLIEHKFAEHPPRNAYGQAPFTTAGDFSTPDDAYFAHADWVIERAAEKGIAVFLAPCYLGQNGGDEGFYREMLASGAASLEAYGRYVGRRYTRFDNIVWVLGGDFTPPSDGLAVVRAMGAGIRSADRRHLFTAHWSAETSSHEVEDPTIRGWLGLDATYTYRPVYEKSLADYERPGALPHFLIESAYENEHESTPRSLRAQAYYALLTGAVGQFFGNGAVWGFWSWRAALQSPGAVSMSHVHELFAGRPWARLIPDVHHRVMTETAGSENVARAVLASAADGTLGIGYIPAGRAATIALKELATPLRSRWYDPSTGAYSAADWVPGATGLAVFTPPRKNAAGDDDWVLVLEPESK
jgi:Protein of unknown function (DUF4038)/Putative collagen-binding domain of a collagenase